MKRPSKDELMLALAVTMSRMSACGRLHVGCVLTDDRYEQIAVGYNGPYRGGPNECLRDEAGKCGCLHAEINACIKARFVPTRAFVSDSPCEACASAMVNAGIRELTYAREYRVTDGVAVLVDAGVQVMGHDPGSLESDLRENFGIRVCDHPYDWRIPCR